jgi:hypothetical protein
MRSDKQIQASKTNGARSRGPVTPQGKRNSSRNSTRHGLLAQTVVLEEECADRFQDLLASFMNEYRPRTASQVALVETMAVTRWRQSRVWRAQKTSMDRDIAAQGRSAGRNSRALLALLGSPERVSHQETLLRYELAFERQFNRALANLLRLQSLPVAGRTLEEKIDIYETDLDKELKTNVATPQIVPKTKPKQNHAECLPPAQAVS